MAGILFATRRPVRAASPWVITQAWFAASAIWCLAFRPSSSFVLSNVGFRSPGVTSFKFSASTTWRHDLTPSIVPQTMLAASASSGSVEAAEKQCLVAVADGTEEIEAITTVNTLVRAGCKVTIASVSGKNEIDGSRGIGFLANCPIEECEGKAWDLVACPGGMPGATNLANSEALDRILKAQMSSGKLVAAICAAPAVVLQSKGMTAGKKATCYPAPAFQDAIEDYQTDAVVVDGNLVTSRGPGTALQFSLKLVGLICGPEKEEEISKQMLAS